MATVRRTGTPATRRTTPARRTPTAQAAAPNLDLARQRVQIEYIDVNDITPYPFNPRDNEKAIPAVAESIKSFGFLVPCVVDDDNVLVAGHTRTEAAKLLGLTEVPCIRARGLSEEQIHAFRLIDNKVAEQAAWDHDLLAGELNKLDSLGLDFTKFGWSQEEIDCLREVVAEDCLSATDVTAAAQASTGENQQRRSPQTARMVLGEIVFFIPVAQYRVWVDGIRSLCDFNEVAIAAEIKRRLGVLE